MMYMIKQKAQIISEIHLFLIITVAYITYMNNYSLPV